MSKIIVGVDESPGSADAIALASELAGLTGAAVARVNVYPYELYAGRGANAEFEQWVRHDSQALLERARGRVDAELRTIANPSPAHGLQHLAETDDAGLIVVGSTHTGRAGRVLPGSTGERLLHGAPCPVAVAPKGYAERDGHSHGIVGCGYDGTATASRALTAARRLADAAGARLRVIRAFTPLQFDTVGVAGTGGAAYNDRLRERAEDELHAATADSDAEAVFSDGDAVTELVEQSKQLDLLVIGSRGYGPLRAVLLGGVAGPLMRDAACPVIVLPRTAGHVAEDSVFASAATVR
jgi:nucleotide-binding universal stress UspA family protein